MISITVCVDTASTPILAYAGGVVAVHVAGTGTGWLVVRWAIVITLISLHIVTKGAGMAPDLKDHLSEGRRRITVSCLLINELCISGEWWLIGVKWPTYDGGWDVGHQQSVRGNG